MIDNLKQSGFEVDGVQLDRDNHEFMLALEYALHTNSSLYLTGKAGSGKTTFLKYLRKVTAKKMVVLAPTGVAAVNAEGQTIHSFFGIEHTPYVPNDKRLRTTAPPDDPDRSTIFQHFAFNDNKRTLIRNLELMVIDEVSMVRADLLDVVDTILRVYRSSYLPFGGVQVILIGDAFQLPPVVKGEDKNILYQFYDSEFFFSSKVIQRNKLLYIELKKIYRQSERDFIDLLNRVRVNQMIQDDFRVLDSRYDSAFHPDDNDNYIILATTNARVSQVNDDKLSALDTPLVTYTAEIKDDFPVDKRPTETNLQLKVGAQVMIIRNNWSNSIYNGMIGTVKATADNAVFVEVDGPHGEKREVAITQEIWENVIFKWNAKEKCVEKTVIGTFTQFPLRLAWAITVHKSQGMTFERVIADVGNSFASGQVYVALSRCTSLNGLVLSSRISPWSVRTDKKVLRFAQDETPETLLTEQLSGSKADYYYGEARRAFYSKKVGKSIEYLYTAIQFRNDIQTKEFKRFISVWMTKLFRSEKEETRLAKESQKLHKEIDLHKSTIEDLQNKLKQAIDAGNESEQTIHNQQTIINRQKNTIKKADLQCQELGRLNEEQKKTISEQEDSIKGYKRKLTEAKRKNEQQLQTIQEQTAAIEKKDDLIRFLNQRINGLEKINKEKEAEIERVSSITWLQKLFGKK